MKTIFSIAILVFLASCVSSPAPEAAKSDSKAAGGTTGSATGGAPSTGIQSLSVPVVRVKNYNQYNMTLEKLTGLNRSAYNGLFDQIKGSMPADNDIGGLTPFNLIAMTRLADAYCKDFINREAATPALGPILNPLNVDNVREFLFNRFLDVASAPEKFSSLEVEVENVLRNDDGTGAGAKLFPNVTNDFNGNKGLATAACVTILASAYITLLE